MNDILSKIVSDAQPLLEARIRNISRSEMEYLARTEAPVRPKFADAFRKSDISILAELKKASPSRGVIRK